MFLRYLVISACFLLAACAGKQQEVFRFNSNFENVQISVGDKSCVTPCKIKLDAADIIPVVVLADGSSHGYDIVMSGRQDSIRNQGKPPKKSTLDDVLSGAGLTIANTKGATPLLLPFLSTFGTTIEFTGNIISNFSSRERKSTVFYYDINSYYIYFSGRGNYALADLATAEYVLGNFYQMRAELYYTETPYIDAFTKQTGVGKARLQELYEGSENAVELYDLVLLEQVSEILDSEDSDWRKIKDLSRLLHYDREKLETLYERSSREEFMNTIAAYLSKKRTVLKEK